MILCFAGLWSIYHDYDFEKSKWDLIGQIDWTVFNKRYKYELLISKYSSEIRYKITNKQGKLNSDILCSLKFWYTHKKEFTHLYIFLDVSKYFQEWILCLEKRYEKIMIYVINWNNVKKNYKYNSYMITYQ